MMKGELPAEPELHLDADDKKPKASQKFPSQKHKPTAKEASSKAENPVDDINEDEFFGNDEDSSEESDNAAD